MRDIGEVVERVSREVWGYTYKDGHRHFSKAALIDDYRRNVRHGCFHNALEVLLLLRKLTNPRYELVQYEYHKYKCSNGQICFIKFIHK